MSSVKRLMTSFGVLVAFVAVFVVTPANAQTLKAVKDRGVLNCGVSEGLYRIFRP